jgi:hypothetical protein
MRHRFILSDNGCGSPLKAEKGFVSVAAAATTITYKENNTNLFKQGKKKESLSVL